MEGRIKYLHQIWMYGKAQCYPPGWKSDKNISFKVLKFEKKNINHKQTYAKNSGHFSHEKQFQMKWKLTIKVLISLNFLKIWYFHFEEKLLSLKVYLSLQELALMHFVPIPCQWNIKICNSLLQESFDLLKLFSHPVSNNRQKRIVSSLFKCIFHGCNKRLKNSPGPLENIWKKAKIFF